MNRATLAIRYGRVHGLATGASAGRTQVGMNKPPPRTPTSVPNLLVDGYRLTVDAKGIF